MLSEGAANTCSHASPLTDDFDENNAALDWAWLEDWQPQTTHNPMLHVMIRIRPDVHRLNLR